MAQDYDKIFREVLKDIFPAVARKVLGIPSGEYKPLPVDLQYTSEREADQLWEVVPSGGKPFILHCGFQAGNDKQMLSRMLLVDLRSFSCQTFLESSGSREVILAILADFEGEPAGLIAEKIISKLEELCEGKPELSQRTLQLVRLAVLRNLGKTVFNTAKKMTIMIDIKEDTLYREVYQEGKEKAALNMLRKGMTTDLISEITELPAGRIDQLRQQLEAGQ